MGPGDLLTYPAILRIAHVELLVASAGGGFHIQVVDGGLVLPCLARQVAVLDQHRRQLAVRVVIFDIRGSVLDPVGAHVCVLVVQADFAADFALPVGNAEIGEPKLEEKLIYLK